MSRIVSYVSGFVEHSGSVVLIFRGPEIIVANIAIFGPFVIDSIQYFILSFVLGALQPVRWENAAAMSAVAAEAADWFLGEGDPSFVINSVLDAGRVGVGDDGSTKFVVSSIGPIDSFSVLDRIVEHQSVYFITGLVDNVGLIEGDAVGEVVSWRINSSDIQNENQANNYR